MFSLRHFASRLRTFASNQIRPPSPPRLLSTSSFPKIDPSNLVEEERLEWYDPNDFYPVRIGDVFQSRYQVIGKLGYGGYSTVWLCRDLAEHRYVAVKVCAQNAIPIKRELAAYQYINNLPRTGHEGLKYLRTALDHFELTNKYTDSSESTAPVSSQSFQCIVLKPMSISVRRFLDMLNCNTNKDLIKSLVKHVLITLDYLHSEAKMIHADLQENNILLALNDDSAFERFEEQERISPAPQKVAGDRIIYTSSDIIPRPMKLFGQPTLCDFGEARFGCTTYTGLIQPHQYRAPEVILGVPWNEKVDIWSVGVMLWNLYEGKHMFRTIGGPENEPDHLYHLAHMVSLLGPPPVEFLKRSETDEPWQYFDAQGNWIGATSLPDDSLERSEQNLEGEEKVQFLDFVRKMVAWKPEDRQSAEELFSHPWLMSRA